jgi:SEC-C motif-containing protein
MQNNCFCGSNKLFSDCCEPIIKGKTQAITAEQLMRSRYSAYASVEPKYLMQTTHFSLLKNQNETDIRAWAEENKWQKLEVIATQKGQVEDSRGEVEFKAYFIDYEGKLQVHHEKSTFLKEAEKWFYSSGIINPKNTLQVQNRNVFCVCGSGKKYKKCCGK